MVLTASRIDQGKADARSEASAAIPGKNRAFGSDFTAVGFNQLFHYGQAKA